MVRGCLVPAKPSADLRLRLDEFVSLRDLIGNGLQEG